MQNKESVQVKRIVDEIVKEEKEGVWGDRG